MIKGDKILRQHTAAVLTCPYHRTEIDAHLRSAAAELARNPFSVDPRYKAPRIPRTIALVILSAALHSPHQFLLVVSEYFSIDLFADKTGNLKAQIVFETACRNIHPAVHPGFALP